MAINILPTAFCEKYRYDINMFCFFVLQSLPFQSIFFGRMKRKKEEIIYLIWKKVQKKIFLYCKFFNKKIFHHSFISLFRYIYIFGVYIFILFLWLKKYCVCFSETQSRFRLNLLFFHIQINGIKYIKSGVINKSFGTLKINNN